MGLRLLSQRNCHLCEEAASLLAEMGAPFEVVDVDGDAALASRFGDAIPVLLADDEELARAPITRSSLRRALSKLASRSGRG